MAPENHLEGDPAAGGCRSLARSRTEQIEQSTNHTNGSHGLRTTADDFPAEQRQVMTDGV